MSQSPLKIWLMAIRPQTLLAAVAPVMMGTAMAFGDGVHHFPTAGVALVGALAIQIGTNLVNDLFDFKKGADTSSRMGPTRVSQAGLISPIAMKVAIGISFLIAATTCFLIVQRAGEIFWIIGAVSILCAVLYTAGPVPLAYVGLGELFVLIFFGPIAVAGTYYAQSMEMNTAVILAGFAPGLFSAAILVVNNLRDINEDRNAGKRTLAVRFGKSFSLTEYLLLIFTASLMPIAIYFLTQDHLPTLAATITLFLAIPVIKNVLTATGHDLNRSLGDTAKLLLVYSILFSIGWLL